MYKKHILLKFLVLVTAITVTPVFTSAALALELPSSHSVTYSRIWGADRYSTMQDLTLAAYGAGSTHAVVVRGDNFPDALAAASYAGLKDCPLVLTPSDLLAKDTLITLLTLGVDGVDIVGGTGAVSDVAATQMEAFGIQVNRIAGNDRYATAYAVYEEDSALWVRTGCAIITTGGDFADALSISPYANAVNAPIFLAGSDGSLDAQSLAAAQTFDSILIVGGTGAVSATTEALFSGKEVVRLGGATAYDTSVEIASWLTGGKPEATFQPSVDFSWEGTAFATRTTFPDALSGSVLQGRMCAPLLLVDDTANAEGVFELLTNVVSQQDVSLRFFGGEGVLSSAVVDRIVALWDTVDDGGSWAYSDDLFVVPDTMYLLNYRAAKAGIELEDESFDQLILVDSSGTTATVYCYTRNASGVFEQTAAVSTAHGFVGCDGVGAASEYVSATPAGLFSLDFAFGVQAAPSTSMVYHQATSNSYWVDDPDSYYYNTWREGDYNEDWSSAEHLVDSPTAYAYGVVIGYNHPSYLVVPADETLAPIPGAGSAIFLHCSTGSPTAGCVSIPKSSMVEVLAWLDPGSAPHILIV
ncbi:MAG: hypothetical protein HGA54_04510 [Actinobacteria bacterium]|nr:hypothetical protein [Actinomycetota bacterium]